jgi:hypothetical protein
LAGTSLEHQQLADDSRRDQRAESTPSSERRFDRPESIWNPKSFARYCRDVFQRFLEARTWVEQSVKWQRRRAAVASRAGLILYGRRKVRRLPRMSSSREVFQG